MAAMTHQAIISELRAIADEAAEARAAGGHEADLLGAYGTLRARAASLALTHCLIPSEQIADQFPSEAALREIERLDLAFESKSSVLPAGRGLSARVLDALVELEGWATGARLAHETLEDNTERRG